MADTDTHIHTDARRLCTLEPPTRGDVELLDARLEWVRNKLGEQVGCLRCCDLLRAGLKGEG